MRQAGDDGGLGEPSGNPNRPLGSLADPQSPNAGGVVEVLSQAGNSVDHESDRLEQGGAQLLMAESLLISGDGSGAIYWTRLARAAYLTIPQSAGAARCLLVEGRARHLDRDASAEFCLRGALRECQALRPVPTLLEAEIACDLILHLGEESRWAAARSVYNQVRPSRMLAPPLSAALLNDLTGSDMSRASDRTQAPRSAGRVMALYDLAQCQAQVAIMAAELCLHPLKRGDDVAARLEEN